MHVGSPTDTLTRSSSSRSTVILWSSRTSGQGHEGSEGKQRTRGHASGPRREAQGTALTARRMALPCLAVASDDVRRSDQKPRSRLWHSSPSSRRRRRITTSRSASSVMQATATCARRSSATCADEGGDEDVHEAMDDIFRGGRARRHASAARIGLGNAAAPLIELQHGKGRHGGHAPDRGRTDPNPF